MSGQSERHHAQARQSRVSARAVLASSLALAVLVAACDSARPGPSGSSGTTSSPQPTVTQPGSAGESAGTSPGASPGDSASAGPGSTATAGPPGPSAGPASVDPFTPPPEMEPLDDDTCLALATRAAVESALGLALGDIRAEGTDPNQALTCTYDVAEGDGQLLVTTAIEGPDDYGAELATATAYGQEPQALEGIGNQAFYAASSAAAPEQVVFTEGPIVVRLWNQTPASIGESAFAALATGVAEAIHGETPPAP